VEIVKRLRGVRGRTGDAFVFPLILGIAVGRIGCFLTGLPDHTHGVHSSLPWAVDFGDGPRHPTQLYEVAFLLMLGMILALRSRRPYGEGELFRIFMLGYLGFRLAVEFVKPVERHAGLSAIQWACLLGIVACVRGLWRVWIQDGAMPIAEVTP
jgi:prolipoprotein diacylglyceryltransferase